MRKTERNRGGWLFVALLIVSGSSMAETLFVTDSILLGVHINPNEESPLLDSIPSGSPVEVIGEDGAFKNIRLPNGKTGWVSSGYLVKEKPASAQVEVLNKKIEVVNSKLSSTTETLKKKERELQIRMDELSNARTTIKDLKRKSKQNKNPIPMVDPKMAEELAAANQEIEVLKQKLSEKKLSEPLEIPADEKQVGETLKSLQDETSILQTRIELAMANLSGELVEHESQLEQLRPRIPAWYWALIILVLIVGLIGGILWMDYRHRLRHGGFRV